MARMILAVLKKGEDHGNPMAETTAYNGDKSGHRLPRM